ncbi:MAG: metallophosphoesterase [Pseudomonadota bacterium]
MPDMLTFSRKKPRHISTAENERIYAIGDIHGRYDLLRQLLNDIVQHFEASDRTFDTVRLLFLGDIVDRGPSSKEVLGLIERLVRTAGATLIRGNHEDLMLRSAQGDQSAQDLWLEHGGLQTLESFEIDPPRDDEDAVDFGERLTRLLPERFLTLLADAPTHFESGHYFFVHAGVRPGVPIKKQTDFDKFFIRDEFTSSTQWHGSMIVHGHSIVPAVEEQENRIAIDTGAYKTGRLSCLCVEGTTRSIITSSLD